MAHQSQIKIHIQKETCTPQKEQCKNKLASIPIITTYWTGRVCGMLST